MVAGKLSIYSWSSRAGVLILVQDEHNDGEQPNGAAEGKHNHEIDVADVDGDRVRGDGTGHHACSKNCCIYRAPLHYKILIRQIESSRY